MGANKVIFMGEAANQNTSEENTSKINPEFELVIENGIEVIQSKGISKDKPAAKEKEKYISKKGETKKNKAKLDPKNDITSSQKSSALLTSAPSETPKRIKKEKNKVHRVNLKKKNTAKSSSKPKETVHNDKTAYIDTSSSQKYSAPSETPKRIKKNLPE